VYRATQLNLVRPVAVKVFHALAGHADRTDLERFRREGVSACRVNHPNALAIIDSGVSSAGIAYLVTELLDGLTVGGELEARGGKMSALRMLEIVQPVCQVLAMAHAVGIIHRDVKPENVFLHNGPTGEVVKVLDFGIAKLLDEPVSESAVTSRRVVLGTPIYMAPEQMCAEPLDGRADVYSLAVMVYEMLTGTLPFDDQFQVMSMLKLTKAPVPMRTHDPDIPHDLDEVVLSALRREPAARPTVTRFEEMLVRAVNA
jgi:serine/threonine protein kinase